MVPAAELHAAQRRTHCSWTERSGSSDLTRRTGHDCTRQEVSNIILCESYTGNLLPLLKIVFCCGICSENTASDDVNATCASRSRGLCVCVCVGGGVSEESKKTKKSLVIFTILQSTHSLYVLIQFWVAGVCWSHGGAGCTLDRSPAYRRVTQLYHAKTKCCY